MPASTDTSLTGGDTTAGHDGLAGDDALAGSNAPTGGGALAGDAARRIGSVVESLPHNTKLGIRMVEIAPGRCTTHIEFRPELVGDPKRGVLHGGVVTTLIDATAGAAVYAAIPEGTSLATLDMRIDYLKPAEPHKRLYASAELYRLTRRIAFVHASAYQDEPESQVAHCAASFMIGSLGFSIRTP